MPCAAAQHSPAVALQPPWISRCASATSHARATGTPASTRGAASDSADHHAQRGERSASTRAATATTSASVPVRHLPSSTITAYRSPRPSGVTASATTSPGIMATSVGVAAVTASASVSAGVADSLKVRSGVAG